MVAVSVKVRCGVPETAGATVLSGGDPCTVAVGVLAATAPADASGLVAVDLQADGVAEIGGGERVGERAGAGDVRPRAPLSAERCHW